MRPPSPYLLPAALALVLVAGCDSGVPGETEPPPPFVSAFVGTYAGTRVAQQTDGSFRTSNVTVQIATVQASGEVTITLTPQGGQAEVLTGTYSSTQVLVSAEVPGVRLQFTIVPSGAVAGTGTFDTTGAEAGTIAITGTVTSARFDLDITSTVTRGTAQLPAGSVRTSTTRTTRS